MSFLWDQLHGAVSCMLGLVDHGFALMRLLGPLQPKFFGKGYGNLQLYYERVASSLANPCDTLGICPGVPTKLSITWGPIRQVSKHVTLQHGKFTSPLAEHLPPESHHCQFQLVRPSKNTTNSDSVVVIMLPATGEMGTWQRIATARHLAHQYGWSSVILTAPYYGSRKPSSQTLFFLSQVSDLQFQSQGIIEEATLLAAHFLSASPETKVCFTGYSFGAAMSSVAASLSLTAGLEGHRLGCALYAGCGTPAMMADGILRHSMDWKAIQSSLAPKEDNETTDAASDTTPPVGLWEELSKTHLARASPPKGNRLAVAKGYAMEYDAFIPTRYSNVYEQQVQSILYPSFTLSWKLGGHAWAAVMRPLLHTQLIVDTVQELVGSSPGKNTLQ
eukprot:Nitzschia sp. Nitz4//scaffold15_size197535//161324//162490//NITZ4_001603-RA/size197535-processed-gene-0.30-mRNA-1//1//CDS//3329537790//6578//frame0